MKTPVVFLVFNRPDLTARVFAEIVKARPEKLLVVADGPRNSNDEEKCRQVREIVEHVDWDCDVLKNYSDTNLGCRKRVSSGLDWAFENVEQAIILEDDCLPHPTFFDFCEAMLDRYRDDERIGHIAGSAPAQGVWSSKYSYRLSRFTIIWGWATWRRAWQYFDADMLLWPEIRALKRHYDMFPDREIAFFCERLWNDVADGVIDTWDAQWLFCQRIRNSFSIIPDVNLVSNIGFGKDALHTKNKKHPCAELPLQKMEFPLKHPADLIVDEEADRRLAVMILPPKPSKMKRIVLRLTNPHFYGKLVRGIPVFGRLWALWRNMAKHGLIR